MARKQHVNVYMQSLLHNALPLVGKYHIDTFFNAKGELYESGQKGQG